MRFVWKGSRKRNLLFAAITLLTAAALPSCLKENTVEPGERKMIIAFGQQSVPFNNIDSATAIFTKQGTTTPYNLKFEKSNGKFEVSMADFTSGIWRMDVMAYSKKDSAGKSFQYSATATMDVAQVSGVLLGAPDQGNSTIWKKHIILSSSNNDIVSITPLDLTNPAFTLIDKDPRWDSFYVKKTAFQTANGDTIVVSSKTWSCGLDCLGSKYSITDTTYFNDFSQYIKTRTWAMGAVEVTLKDNESSDTKAFIHTWNK
ncbi:MAG TPA: hypothetical protein VLC28_03315 [Flavitalea sp.]|nr:hypothetical protein [Flavitalea sp.]